MLLFHIHGKVLALSDLFHHWIGQWFRSLQSVNQEENQWGFGVVGGFSAN